MVVCPGLFFRELVRIDVATCDGRGTESDCADAERHVVREGNVLNDGVAGFSRRVLIVVMAAMTSLAPNFGAGMRHESPGPIVVGRLCQGEGAHCATRGVRVARGAKDPERVVTLPAGADVLDDVDADPAQRNGELQSGHAEQGRPGGRKGRCKNKARSRQHNRYVHGHTTRSGGTRAMLEPDLPVFNIMQPASGNTRRLDGPRWGTGCAKPSSSIGPFAPPCGE